MSEMIDAAVKALNAKLSGGFDGVAKFVIPGEGAIMLDATGVRAGDDEADVTLEQLEVGAVFLDDARDPQVDVFAHRLLSWRWWGSGGLSCGARGLCKNSG